MPNVRRTLCLQGLGLGSGEESELNKRDSGEGGTRSLSIVSGEAGIRALASRLESDGRSTKFSLNFIVRVHLFVPVSPLQLTCHTMLRRF